MKGLSSSAPQGWRGANEVIARRAPTPGPCHWCDRRGAGAWTDVRTRRGLMTRAATNVFVSRYLRSRCGSRGRRDLQPGARTTRSRKRRRNGTSAATRIVGAGRFVREKGFDLLIRAMGQVDARLVLAGDGPLRGASRRSPPNWAWERRSPSVVG